MDFKSLKELIKLFNGSGLSKLSVKDKDLEVSLEAQSTSKSTRMEFGGMKELSEIGLEETIDSPMVGTFYRSVSPDDEAFVEVGDRIKKGDTLCIIEAMKVMNEIKTDRDLLITDICVEDGAPVEFGQVMFVVE